MKRDEKKKKVVVVITDGVGLAPEGAGNAVSLANTPTFDRHWGPQPLGEAFSTDTSISIPLRAHGEFVGLPDGVMGNSEVGHSTIFCGKPYDELLPAINKAIETKELFKTTAWKHMISKSEKNCIHFLGLLSDGKVHSNIEHLFAMLRECAKSKIKKVKIWALTDGRDVPPSSADKYLAELQQVCNEINISKDFDYSVAMIAGRAGALMDRGEDNWARVEKAWNAFFFSEGKTSNSVTEALKELRAEKTGSFTDEHLDLRLIKDSEGQLPKITTGDSLLLFNYRTDRILEFCSWMLDQPLTERALSQGVVRKEKPKDVFFVTMSDFDPDTLPLENCLLPALKIENTLVDFLGEQDFKILCVSEPSKFPHVTLFPNGRSNEKPKHCDWKLVPSTQRPPFNTSPKMKTDEIASEIISAMKSEEHELIIANFPSPDMVGHETNLESAIQAVESADSGIAKICKMAEQTGHVIIYGGDHGNAEKMYELENGKPIHKDGKLQWYTAHTTNLVRWVIFTPDESQQLTLSAEIKEPSLGNLSSTIALALGFHEKALPKKWLKALLR